MSSSFSDSGRSEEVSAIADRPLSSSDPPALAVSTADLVAGSSGSGAAVSHAGDSVPSAAAPPPFLSDESCIRGAELRAGAPLCAGFVGDPPVWGSIRGAELRAGAPPLAPFGGVAASSGGFGRGAELRAGIPPAFSLGDAVYGSVRGAEPRAVAPPFVSMNPYSFLTAVPGQFQPVHGFGGLGPWGYGLPLTPQWYQPPS
jgi:hypothetical protein